METDKRYFFEGLFIIGLCAAAAFFFVWLAGQGHRDDERYRIYFADSVSGLAVGDAVKFHGVDVGEVEAMSIDQKDARRVRVDLRLRQGTPIKTDTRASLKLKGITGAVLVDLDGGGPDAQSLAANTTAGQTPEIPANKTVSLSSIMERLPKVIDKFSSIEDQTHKVLSNVGEVVSKVKENPSLLLRGPKVLAAPAAPQAPGKLQAP